MRLKTVFLQRPRKINRNTSSCDRSNNIMWAPILALITLHNNAVFVASFPGRSRLQFLIACCTIHIASFPGRSRLQFLGTAWERGYHTYAIKNWRRERPGNEATVFVLQDWERGYHHSRSKFTIPVSSHYLVNGPNVLVRDRPLPSRREGRVSAVWCQTLRWGGQGRSTWL